MSETDRSGLRWTLRRIIFGTDTPAGRRFDVVLIINILLSVIVVMIDSVQSIRAEYGSLLYQAEWFFTIIFSMEYLLRLYSADRAVRYARSFYGVIDLLAVMPTYLSLLLPGSQYLIVIRLLRVLRIFRVLKLAHYVGEASILVQALRASMRKITVFIFTVLTLVVIFGSLMYLIEGPRNGFSSIPASIYWAIVTLTTVGYGDVAPQTGFGQLLASVIMIVGYAIIAVPTGIVTVEMSQAVRKGTQARRCPNCDSTGHDGDAKHCKFCGGTIVLSSEPTTSG